MEDLTGKTFGEWTVLYRDPIKQREPRWICKCMCGTEKSVLGKYLRNGSSKSCGCTKKLTHNKTNFIGERHKNLEIIDIVKSESLHKNVFLCKCDCGNIIEVDPASWEHKASCGCGRFKNIVGQRFGNLIVKEMLYKYKDGATYCKCDCSCGKTDYICRMNGLVTGNTKSCGCIHSPSLVGQKFGRLTVIAESGRERNQKIWECKCDCGTTTFLSSYVLTSGHTLSCGCLRSESVSSGETKIAEILQSHNFNYEKEKTFTDCKGLGGKSLRFDFYLPEYNTVIEYDGQQHFMPIKYFGGIEKYNYLKENEKIKEKYCHQNNITLIRFPYTMNFSEIENKITTLKNPVTITA